MFSAGEKGKETRSWSVLTFYFKIIFQFTVCLHFLKKLNILLKKNKCFYCKHKSKWTGGCFARKYFETFQLATLPAEGGWEGVIFTSLPTQAILWRYGSLYVKMKCCLCAHGCMADTRYVGTSWPAGLRCCGNTSWERGWWEQVGARAAL